MNKNILNLIFILATISLVAALITQLLWVKVTWEHERDQFEESVDISLKTVVNRLMSVEEYYSVDTTGADSSFYREHYTIFQVVGSDVLDLLIKNEFAPAVCGEDFVYGVYRQTDSLFIMGNFNGFEKELISSPFTVSLTCICRADGYLLSVYFPEQTALIWSSIMILPVMSGLFLLILVLTFFYTIYFIIKQKKLSEMKTDFVNNMTHEFKTPIATISVSSEMLMSKSVSASPEKIRKYASIILNENLRLKNQVERVLQIATVNKGNYNFKMEPIDVHRIIQSCVTSFKIVINKRNGQIKTELKAGMYVITGDKHHFTNVVNNLLDNAGKYCDGKPEITVLTTNNEGKIIITIKDNGVGIPKESQKRIFGKFQRLQKGDVHDKKGVGLGLYYVKIIVEAMGGNVFVNSEPGKGSEFKLSFPV